jgi:response regulator RpfG family c-di-GMP phosphodiesterase
MAHAIGRVRIQRSPLSSPIADQVSPVLPGSVVDDEEDMRKAIVDTLSHDGYMVCEARNGAAAWNGWNASRSRWSSWISSCHS